MAHVVVIACNEGTLPHTRTFKVDVEDIARGEGVEAERRLCYVAFTRAEEHLEIHYDKQSPSRFLQESGIIAPARAPRTPPPVPNPRAQPLPSAGSSHGFSTPTEPSKTAPVVAPQ